MRYCSLFLLVFAAAVDVATGQDYANVQTVVTGLIEPASMSSIPGDDSRLIVAEKRGRLRVVSVTAGPGGELTYSLVPAPMLDLAALDASRPFFRDTQGQPLRDQSGVVVPRLVRHGGATVPHLGQQWTPSREVEQGFFSVAFAPDYATSGLLYVNYTQSNPNTDPSDAVPDGHIDWTYFASGGNFCRDRGRSVIVEYRRDASNPNAVDPLSERLIMAVPKPFPGHNGGTLRFGPDGMLWFGLGDGGSEQDDENRALNTHELFGKFLRIDLSRDDFPADPERNYGIPPDNPFAGGVGGRPEVFARGVRNPWQWRFDRWNNDVWIGDVGLNLWEEINRVPAGTMAGRNFGWRAREGNRTTGFDLGGHDVADLTSPVYAYPHSTGQPDAFGYAPWQIGSSTAGGVVYRGGSIRPWRGRLVFADTFSYVWTVDVGDGAGWSGLAYASDVLRTSISGVTPPSFSWVVSLAEDNAGEVFFVEYVAGRIRKLVPQGAQPPMADIGRQGGEPGSDGALDTNDFVVFIDFYFMGDYRADMGRQGGLIGVDQRLDNNDFVAFIDAFFSGL